MANPRIGIVLTKFISPSEVWALRQAEAFERLEPVYFAETRRPDALPLPEGRELYLFKDDEGRREGRREDRRDRLGTLARRAARRLGWARGAWPARGEARRIARTIEAARVDIVLSHYAWNGIALAQALPRTLPIVCHVHGRDVTAMLRYPYYRRALAEALPRFAHVIAVARYQQEVLAELCPGIETSLIPCGAPTAVFAAKPLPEREPGDPVVFISVGRVAAEKGQLQSLAAFEAIAPDLPEARLVLVGDGPSMEQLRAAVEASPVRDRVRLAGLLRSEAVAEALSRAHVYLQHSRPVNGWMEGFPTTLVEAGAAGLPLIATRVGGIPDQVLEGENGFLIEPDDVAAQATAMARLARDEDLRRRMGARARAIAQSYDSTATAARLEGVLLRHLP
jgi:glycosyltransferase involved in cell wall biosynthesis